MAVSQDISTSGVIELDESVYREGFVPHFSQVIEEYTLKIAESVSFKASELEDREGSLVIILVLEIPGEPDMRVFIGGKFGRLFDCLLEAITERASENSPFQHMGVNYTLPKDHQIHRVYTLAQGIAMKKLASRISSAVAQHGYKNMPREDQKKLLHQEISQMLDKNPHFHLPEADYVESITRCLREASCARTIMQ